MDGEGKKVNISSRMWALFTSIIILSEDGAEIAEKSECEHRDKSVKRHNCGCLMHLVKV